MAVSPKFNSFPVPSPCFRARNTFPVIFHGYPQLPRSPTVKCVSSDNGENGSLKDKMSGLVDAQVEELLMREENRALLDGLDRASQRVEKARRELAEIQKQEMEARQLREYVEQLESRSSEIAECQKEILEARAMVEQAERALSSDLNETQDGSVIREGEQINKDEERLETIKAATVSAIVGTLAALPISLSQVTSISQLILPVGINFLSCALFGVTFRYTIRRDLDNIQLKTGSAAAFAFVKGLAALGAGPPLELSPGSFLSHALDGALYISESLLIFAFAAVGVDFCFKMRLISAFPIKRTNSN